MARVAVVGVGAIGAYFAAHLLEGGQHDVVLCVRRPFDELVLESSAEVLRSHPRVLTDPAELAGEPPVDWVLLATKAHQTPSAAGWLAALAGPATTVAVLQNGVEHVERVQPLVPDSKVLPAVVYCGAEQVAPGHVVHRTNGFLLVPDDDSGRALMAMFHGTGAEVRCTTDFTSSAWTKLCSNVVANGITALSGRRMEVFRTPEVADLGRALCLECITVARAKGAEVDDAYADLLVAGIAAMPDDSGTSMLYDRLAGRPLEIDAKYGAVLRAAARHGIPAPRHETMLGLLTAISAGPDDARSHNAGSDEAELAAPARVEVADGSRA